jgi:hypothetical protein
MGGFSMIILKSDEEIGLMREAGRLHLLLHFLVHG